ncbi:hypothetical protein ACQW02_22870 [Humitalea sp. 24SJ18S-53]|uniref:hypothetical protein n=1 Tax=Humitalea sp. 24SJ18S-53 TaxID=3422307 RepID=UPI003D66E5AC
MKRQRSEKFRGIPTEAGVRLRPKAWIAFNTAHPPLRDPRQIALQMRAIRGQILGASFAVEHALIVLEMAEIYRDKVDQGATLEGYSDLDQQRRCENSLERKIDRAKVIIRKHLPIDRADPMVQRMAGFREVRNLMAHYASWLEPINDEVRGLTTDFVLYIGDQSHVWTIDDEQIRQWIVSFVELMRDLTKLTFQLKGAAEPTFAEGDYSVITAEAIESEFSTANAPSL